MTPKKDNTGYLIMDTVSHLFMRTLGENWCGESWTWIRRVDDATRFKHIRQARTAYLQTAACNHVTIIPYREAKRLYGEK